MKMKYFLSILSIVIVGGLLCTPAMAKDNTSKLRADLQGCGAWSGLDVEGSAKFEAKGDRTKFSVEVVGDATDIGAVTAVGVLVDGNEVGPLGLVCTGCDALGDCCGDLNFDSNIDKDDPDTSVAPPAAVGDGNVSISVTLDGVDVLCGVMQDD
ncbi:MAG TPA: hypothetical protein EYQ35_02265 [candidate division UBP10 bacterium]|nr:hypothetical protein [Candidatus Binatota bacterium]